MVRVEMYMTRVWYYPGEYKVWGHEDDPLENVPDGAYLRTALVVAPLPPEKGEEKEKIEKVIREMAEKYSLEWSPEWERLGAAYIFLD